MKKRNLLIPVLIVAAFICGSQFASRTTSAPVDTVRSSYNTVYTQQNENVGISKATKEFTATPRSTATPKPKEEKKQYVLNTNTKKFHIPSCSSVKQMKEKNKLIVTKTRQEIIDDGYDPCGRCHP